MGILDRFIKSDNRMEREMADQQLLQQLTAPTYDQPLGGQPLPPPQTTVIPPALDRETMELYLKVKVPEDIDDPKKMVGSKRFWVFTNPATAVEVPTSNMNAHRQRKILRKLETAIDFTGCDNASNLINDEMLMIHAEVLTDKARSDFNDGLRERVVPSVGIGMTGQYRTGGDTGERPKESRALFGLINRGGQR